MIWPLRAAPIQSERFNAPALKDAVQFSSSCKCFRLGDLGAIRTEGSLDTVKKHAAEMPHGVY